MFTGVLQALIFWAFVAAVILVPGYLRSRDRQRLHDTIRAAYEKGQPVPPEVIAALTRNSSNDDVPSSNADKDLRRGLVLLAVGLGMAGLGAGFYFGISMASDIGGAVVGGIIAGVGAIPGFIGLAFLLLWLVNRKAPKA
ncbi:MAG: DUF6249 domain-containing protein [Caulobacterales bacterium]